MIPGRRCAEVPPGCRLRSSNREPPSRRHRRQLVRSRDGCGRGPFAPCGAGGRRACAHDHRDAAVKAVARSSGRLPAPRRRGTNTGPARAALAARWEREGDPDLILDPAERERRAGFARRAFYQELANRSVEGRRAQAGRKASARHSGNDNAAGIPTTAPMGCRPIRPRRAIPRDYGKPGTTGPLALAAGGTIRGVICRPRWRSEGEPRTTCSLRSGFGTEILSSAANRRPRW